MKDKQLNVERKQVMEKRRMDQALSMKEFAMAAGISYSVARNWFRFPGFPTFQGVVFWSDFVEWRKRKVGLGEKGMAKGDAEPAPQHKFRFTGKAAQILAEAGCIQK